MMKRIGLIKSVDKTTVYFLGYGKFLGDFNLEPQELGFIDISVAAPMFKLDDGRVYHGVEYWWASEEEVQEKLSTYENMGFTIILE